MSKYVVGQVEYDDLPALKSALESLFGKGSVDADPRGQNTLVAYGYQSDSREHEIGRVAAVVRRKFITSASNDLPIVRGKDGKYRIVISEYDSQAIPRRLNWQVSGSDALEGRFKQAYGLNQLRTALPKLGYKLAESVSAEGTVKIKATVGGGGSGFRGAEGVGEAPDATCDFAVAHAEQWSASHGGLVGAPQLVQVGPTGKILRQGAGQAFCRVPVGDKAAVYCDPKGEVCTVSTGDNRSRLNLARWLRARSKG